MAEPQTITFKFLGETMGFWVQTGALIISAIAAVWIILSGAKNEKRRATVDLVIEQKKDSELLNAKRALLQLHEAGKDNFARYLDDRNCDEFKNIISILNNNEFVATGIREKSFDEMTYKRLQYSVIVRDWEAFSGFVMEFRKQTKKPTLFQEFEWLARRWQRAPLKQEKLIVS